MYVYQCVKGIRKEQEIHEVNMHTRPHGTVFQMSKDKKPFSIQQGDVVTIAYDSLKKRHTVPVDPVIVRKRDDFHWRDANIKQITPVSMFFLSCYMKILILSFRWILEGHSKSTQFFH